MNTPAAAEPAPLRRSAALERRLRRRRQEARMRLRLAADAVVLCKHHASQVPRFVLSSDESNALAAEVKLLRRDLEQLRAQMARPSAAAAASAEAADPPAASAAPPPTAAAGPTSVPDDTKMVWEDDLAGLFLRECVLGAKIVRPVLDETGAELPDVFVLDNAALLAMGRDTRFDICLRLSPDLADRHKDERAMAWGSLVRGQLRNG